MLTDEQLKEIKKQIIKQIDENFPEDKKVFTKNQIQSMTPMEFENFLIENNIIRDANDTEIPTQECIFCSIKEGKVDSFKINENNEAIAILEINPVSKAHTLIIPKEHDSKIPESIIDFANKTAEKIKEVFSPKNIEISESELFGHKLLNIIPIYEKSSLERKKASKEELSEIQNQIINNEKKEIKLDKVQEKEPEIPKRKVLKNVRLPKRIP